jgi:deoxyribodipyrimidine photo-lyase
LHARAVGRQYEIATRGACRRGVPEKIVAAVPLVRIRALNPAPVNASGDYVLYWMIAFRRARWNFSLDRAVEWCRELSKPMVIFEALRCDYPWASERLHRFVLEGMAANARQFAAAGAFYFPYVEPSIGAAKGLFAAVAKRACVVITDDFPAFFLPSMMDAAAKKCSVRLESVDSNGLLPLRAAAHAFPTAFAFRRFLQKELPKHLQEMPARDALARTQLPRLKTLPPKIFRRWPAASAGLLNASGDALTALPIDHSLVPASARGGSIAAERIWRSFLKRRLARYLEDRNEPELEGASGLSAYLHFGHMSSHQIFAEVARSEKWTEARLALRATGSRSGWWRMSEAAEAFLDQLVTWRELGFNFCAHRGDADRYESLPEWARATLEKHAGDRRKWRYTLEEFKAGQTHDPLWNAAQTQLVRDGRLHNYLRMLWGKKILEWSKTPREALRVMIELNNRYALDGRDPSSYSGIFWCLGRYDRPWGPEREIFGTVRYMSSENTARKHRVREYLKEYAPSANRPIS